jgi:Domain of unknown function (DUF3332)
MKVMTRRTVLSFAALTTAAATTGCWGSFAATNKLWKFNDGISESKWIKWLLFLGLIIVPVYSLFIFGDAIIFNTIEFFTDKNPLSATRDMGNGHQVAFERDPKNPDLVRVEHRHHGKLVGTWYVERHGDRFSVLDERRAPIAMTREHENDGAVSVVDANGTELARIDADAFRKASSRVKETGSPRVALGEVLDERATRELVARGRGALQTL